MTKTGPTISSLLLPRHLGGPLMHFDEPTPPTPPPPAPPAPPSFQHQTPPAPPAAPPSPPAAGQRIEDVRAEAAGYRIEARTERERREAAEANSARIQSEADARVRAAEQQGATVATKIKERTADAELRAQATAAGLADLELLPLIDRSKITVDDDGNVTGATEAIAEFKTKKPNYFQQVTVVVPPVPRTGFAAPPITPGAPPPTPPSVRTADPAAYGASKAAALRNLKG